eukprot:TRINITY_DN1093_c0_g1_i2.p1 TRINITY_DN1093_c0_g1~~TRINITY_DN1093_c0_g1_i2.p1  ORF type:complete len:956 (-),score=362.75 TRINITY_DN1093_c0_g1_i2:31-2898(-)
MSEEQNNIRVICRFRPQNKIETNAGGSPILQITEGKNIYLNPESGQKQHFSFDRVFDGSCTQREVYEAAAKPVIDFLLEGYNGTLFVYGQTSSGKTHTMQGPDIDDDNLKGIIPRMVEDIFNSIAEADESMEFLVQVSYVEIYREKIQDLLNPEKKNLNVRQNQQKGVYIEFCTEVYVSCREEVLNVIKTGQSNRSISSTEMNAESSRSHSIFIITVISNNTSQGTKKQARLYLVDLAGSEKVAKTGAKGDTLKEAQAINQSLSALGNVINALTEGGTNKHIPYRDSKLTRILQESLGGNSKTTLIINCSPSSYNYDETVSTLRFGNRAKSIKNTPKQNKQRSVEELTVALEHAEGTISKLNILVSSLANELKVFKGDINIDLLNPSSSSSFSSPNLSTTISNNNDNNTNNNNNNNTIQISQNNTTSSETIKELQLKIEKLEESLSVKEKELSQSLEQQDLLQQTLQAKEMEVEENGKKIEEFKENIQISLFSQQKHQQENEILLNKLADLRIQLNKKEYELQLNLSEIETLQSSQQNSEKEMGQLQNQVSTLLHSLQDKEQQVQKLQNLQSLHSYHTLQINNSTNGSLTLNGSPRSNNTDISQNKTESTNISTTNSHLYNTSSSISENTINSNTNTSIHTLTKNTEENKNKESFGTTENTENTENTESNTDNTDNTSNNTESNTDNANKETLVVVVNESKESDVSSASTTEVSEKVETLEKKTDQNVSSTTSDSSTQESNEDEKSSYEKVRKEVQEEFERKMKEKETEFEKNQTHQFLQIHQIIENSKNSQKEKIQKMENMRQSIVNDLSDRCHKVIDFKALLEESVKKFKLLISDSNSRDLMKKNFVLEKNITHINDARSQLVRQNQGLKLKLSHEEKNSKIKTDRIDQIEKEIQEMKNQFEQKDSLHREQLNKLENLVQYYEKNSKGQHYQKTYSNIAVPIRGGSKKPTNNK